MLVVQEGEGVKREQNPVAAKLCMSVPRRRRAARIAKAGFGALFMLLRDHAKPRYLMPHV